MNNKENVIYEFNNMIKNSWTYEKMTTKEKLVWNNDVLGSVRTNNALKGNYNQRWNILQAIYGAYLYGIGYDDFNWRDESEDDE